MRIDILTLFPKMFDGFLSESIIKRAINDKKVSINIYNIRDYSLDPHKKVDDYGFGGGAGMVLMPQPIFDCVDSLRTDESFVILMTPQGVKYNQKMAYEFTNKKHIIIICGHYEGFDERIRLGLKPREISIGDYVLTGGELGALVLIDSISRNLENYLGKDLSAHNDSFSEGLNGLLEYPHYTKPREYRGMAVPEVLLNGNHKEIENFRKEESLKRTKTRRPDLLS